MTPCETVLSQLWDRQPATPHHPDHDAIQSHLQACPACRAEALRIQELRGCLKGLAGAPDADFEAGLKARLATLAAGRPDPQAGRFEPDPFLEEAPREALLVDRRSRAAWLVKPLGLVAAGAAAAILVGLIGRWSARPDSQPGAAPVLAGAPPAQVAADSQAARVPETRPATGVLAERAWQEGDSAKVTDAPEDRPDRRERLTPVTTTP
jgi:anti-sigma factor RsiW